jgi:hypothetical protein
MRRYNIVACIFLILSVFGFVHAAPVAVQEVREARADVVDGGEKVIIGSGKRAETEEEGSSSAPNYASGTHPNPSFSSGESNPPPLPMSGGTELWWNPEGGANLIQPGSSTNIQPASSSKAKSVSFAPSKEVKLPSGFIYSEILQPEIKPPPPGPEGHQPNQPTSSSNAKPGSLPPWKEVKLPSGLIYSEMLPPGHEVPEPESESIFSKLASKVKFWRRISGTAGGVVTEGQKDLQGTVDT